MASLRLCLSIHRASFSSKIGVMLQNVVIHFENCNYCCAHMQQSTIWPVHNAGTMQEERESWCKWFSSNTEFLHKKHVHVDFNNCSQNQALLDLNEYSKFLNEPYYHLLLHISQYFRDLNNHWILEFVSIWMLFQNLWNTWLAFP